jgi:hypothetical protein
MLKWLLTVVLGLVLLAAFTPWYSRLRLGRLPGDVQFCVRGRTYFVPITTTVLLSLALTWLNRVL